MTDIDVGAKNLEDRVLALERTRFQCSPDVVLDDSMRRARSDVEQKLITSARWKWVPPHYYDLALAERAKLLSAPSTSQLCKCLLLENKKHTSENDKTTPDGADPTNPRFILVMIQYEATLDERKLVNSIIRMRPVLKDRMEANDFDIRVASSEDNDRLTGYAYNSVTPFGMNKPKDIQIVLAEAIKPLHFFWMGGGHVHLKLGMAVSDFVKATSAWVADVSSP
eukprot:CAMPEP_0194213710 /NCGR_PEP_ID=MMETSP0156-20130528/14495_1 /TAXON_ID=33649 /ORGANISM="Thalassionema nitzschioides, Strain L26-B" /LENGTH=223 /DNA_ID=CAMNT_0038941807 /DNA_START=17 /DNA_END=685 /DNA_ORIENTATION=-